MATSNLSLKSMLSKERVQHVRWIAISSSTQEPQNPVWRGHLCQWYFHALESIERFDGNRGAFPRSVAHVAMKILDMFLCSRSMDDQLLARVDERVYKPVAWACLYNAMRRCSIDRAAAGPHLKTAPPSHFETDGGDVTGITVNGRHFTETAFLQMCHGSNLTTPDQFASLVASISSFLDSFECFNDTLPLTASHVSDIFGRMIRQQFSQETHPFEDATFLQKLEACMDETVSNSRFARYPPSLNSAAAILVAMPDSIDRAVLLHLLTQYRMSGGYALSTLRDVVEELRLEMDEGAPLEEWEARDDNREVVHIIPS